MRFCLRVWAAAALGLVMFTTASAHADAPRTADGDGVVLGSVDAPVQLEIFCEPQCPDCKEFESTYGDRIAGDIAGGRLAVTYRWLTFLDAKHHNDVSARVSNALFVAADPATAPTAYQAFVQDLYRHQSHPDPLGPSNADIAAMARDSGITDDVANRIAAGEQAVDTAAANAANRARLGAVNPENPGTPTVYDLKANRLVDVQDPGWLDALAS